MTTPIPNFDGLRINTADATAGWEDYDGSKYSGSTESDFFYQGTASQSIKVGTSREGPGYDDAGTVDYTAGNGRVFLAKVIATNYAALKTTTDTDFGGQIRLSSGGLASNNADYYVVGGNTYPTKGGWLIVPIDPQVTASAGSANSTAIDGYAWHCNFNTASRAANVAMDAIDHMEIGKGLSIKDGTTSPCSFQNFIDHDEGATATDGGRYGVVSTQDGIIYTTGTLTIGETGGVAAATTFTDSGQILVFPEAQFIGTAGFFGLDLNLSNASTAVTISDSIFKSVGTVAAGNKADTRPTYGITGTSGTATYDGCTFDVFNSFTANSALTVTDCIFNNGLLVTATSGTFSGCTFAGQTTGAGVAYMSAGTNIANITNCSFDLPAGATGHAIEITSAGTTITLDNIIFTGYGTGTTGDKTGTLADAAILATTATTLTINVDGGTIPTVSVSGGGTVTVSQDITVTATVQDSGGTAIPGASVQFFEQDGTQIGTNQITNASGQASVVTDGSTRTIIAIVRQSANTAQVASLATNQLTTTDPHKFNTGDAVVWDETNGSITGLTNGTTYYVEVIDADTVEMYSTAAAAIAAGGGIALSSLSGNPEMNPVRYVNNSANINIAGASTGATVTMVVDSIARDTVF